MSLLCRSCQAPLTTSFVDLGSSPLANSYRPKTALATDEPRFPLHVYVCTSCKLVQLPEHQSPEAIFSDYSYFSSWSDSWLAHCKHFVEQVATRFHLGAGSRVVELASNDGYLLRNFVERGVPVLGIEPAANVAKVAVERGVPTCVDFFGKTVATRVRADFGAADLLVANNVLAHVPDINDFVAGVAELLASQGVASFEFPHLLELIRKVEFDTIYHEHFSYLSLVALSTIFQRHGLRMFDVEELTTHGGSLRVYVSHRESSHTATAGLAKVVAHERREGLHELATYAAFATHVAARQRTIRCFLMERQEAGKRIAAYGAPAKATTLLNSCRVGADVITFTVDRSPEKQGGTIPGTGIPILAPQALRDTPLDCVVILAWNLRDEIAAQLRDLSSRGVELSVLVPDPMVL